MKFKNIVKSPFKEAKDSLHDIRNPGKKFKEDFKDLKKDIQNPGEAVSDRWENFKDNPVNSVRPSMRGPFSAPRPGGPGANQNAISNMPSGPAIDPGYSAAYHPPRNTRISPGIYADGRGGVIRSARPPGPVDHSAAVFHALATGAGGESMPYPGPPQLTGNRLADIAAGAADVQGYGPGKPLSIQGATPMPTLQDINTLEWQSPNGQLPPKAEQHVVPNSNVRYGDVARGGAPANQPPPRGTRISPGVYADGSGGTYRSLDGR